MQLVAASSVESVKRRWQNHRNPVDPSEYFDSVYCASREDLMVPPTSLNRQRWHDDVARVGNSRSPVLPMRVSSRRIFLCCNHEEDF
jgi:hypothetical protein